jgi:phosphoribosyl 1,2-cyclic phosphodiesterase
MHLRVLGSSSAGNSTLVWNDRNALLVDCGLPPRYLLKHLSAPDMHPPAITGLLITHAHGDHVNNDAIALMLENRIPVYVRHELVKVLRHMYPSMDRASRLGMLRDFDGQGVELGSFEVRAFGVPHDAPGGCFGFAISEGSGPARRKLSIATDLGFARDGLVDEFRDSDAIVIESNHDLAMLENSGRPAWLKKRIREIGHLSNDQCASFVTDIIRSSAAPPRGVVLAHISEQCNTNALADETTSDALRASGFSSVSIVQSFRAAPSAIVEC